MPELLRVFLDANVLFSASFQPDHDFLEFWREPAIVCMTSFYAAEEARRNCGGDAHRKRLEALLEITHLVSDATTISLPEGQPLASKDQPILAAAIQAGADFLVTGDNHHFGHLMNLSIPTQVGTLRVISPRALRALLSQSGST